MIIICIKKNKLQKHADVFDKAYNNNTIMAYLKKSSHILNSTCETLSSAKYFFF